MSLLVKYNVKIMLRAQSAEAGPPLGTVLGNLGVNTIKFCKEFNEFTEGLENYFKIGVNIHILENKTYSFVTSSPSLGYILSLLRYENEELDLLEVIKLSKFILPAFPLEKSVPVIFACIKSSGLIIN